jgi:hypothetical protein
MDNQAKVMIAAFLAISAALIVKTIATAIVRYAEVQRRRDEISPSLIQDRLERIEIAVDAIAIEVERLGEHQRFNAQLAMNRPAPLPPKAITPH